MIVSLVCSSCSLGRRFASDFLQIPRHHGHPCLWLTPTTAFEARDFHPKAYTHAGRTQKAEETYALQQERKIQETLLSIKKKYGKNAILKGMNLQEGATAKDRNNQIGGHKA